MNQETARYYVPAPSTWPITGSIALLFMGFGAAFSVNKIPAGYWLLTIGFSILFYMIFGWFRTVARESEAGKFNDQVDKSFRWGMSWFIFSEVMFLPLSLARCIICEYYRFRGSLIWSIRFYGPILPAGGLHLVQV